ncbi:MAG: response regulator [Paracoccaceae bacterium]|nr:response regulator [Paracoccaceae bacterium]
MTKILIIDDSPEDREFLTDLAEQAGTTECHAFSEAKPAIEFLAKNGADAIFLDHKLDPEISLVHIPRIRRLAPDAEIVLVTGHRIFGLDRLVQRFSLRLFLKDNLNVETVARIIGHV